MHLRFIYPFLFFLSLILSPFYYLFPWALSGLFGTHSLEAIIHKRGVHFIWVAFYIQTRIKCTKLTLPMQLSPKKVLPCEQLSCLWPSPWENRWVVIISCSPNIISLLPNRANKKFHLIAHYTNSDLFRPQAFCEFGKTVFSLDLKKNVSHLDGCKILLIQSLNGFS